MNREFWTGRRVLVTGHTGFKGSWLSLWLAALGAHVAGLALEAEDDPAVAYRALAPWPGLDMHVVDLRDADGVTSVVAAADPEVVFHLGAQALVRGGYADPLGTYAVNVLGTANVLQAARSASSLRSVLVVTSDKVYANPSHESADPTSPGFAETDPLGGGDPYSNSKACADLLATAWRESFFNDVPVSIGTARAGNVIGGGDRGADRLLPDVWRALESGHSVRLRYPGSVRPWQFVLEPVYGYLVLAERLTTAPDEVPPALNIGPDRESCVAVADVVERVFSIWGTGSWELEAGDHAPEAVSLYLDASLAKQTLGWQPVLDLDTALAWTTDWWRSWQRGEDLRRLATRQIHAYEERLA